MPPLSIFPFCRGAIDGTLPQAAARCLQSMPAFLHICMSVFHRSGSDHGGDGGDDDNVLPAWFLACYLLKDSLQ